jgi:glycine hydroxymethyltransferase
MGLSPEDGGHWALRSMTEAQRCVFEPIPITADGKVDAAKLAAILKSKRPALVMVDPSHSLEVISPEVIRSVLSPDVPLFYDLSHFMGIVPHQYLMDPFGRGITAIHGSTHKSLFGPQKGLIVFGQSAGAQLIKKISVAAEKILTSNCHLHHVAALGVCLQEYRQFGESYAGEVVKHARGFARTLAGQGLEVLSAGQEFTNSHQVIITLAKNAEAVWSRLTAAGLLTNLIRPPRQKTLGIRFGLAEVTRRGYAESEIEQVARFVASLVKDVDHSGQVSAAVSELAHTPRRMKFCFE